MEKCRTARDKWNEARWKVVLLDEINEYLNLIEVRVLYPWVLTKLTTYQVTTKKVTHLYGPPIVGKDDNLSNLTLPTIDPREGMVPEPVRSSGVS